MSCCKDWSESVTLMVNSQPQTECSTCCTCTGTSSHAGTRFNSKVSPLSMRSIHPHCRFDLKICFLILHLLLETIVQCNFKFVPLASLDRNLIKENSCLNHSKYIVLKLFLTESKKIRNQVLGLI